MILKTYLPTFLVFTGYVYGICLHSDLSLFGFVFLWICINLDLSFNVLYYVENKQGG